MRKRVWPNSQSKSDFCEKVMVSLGCVAFVESEWHLILGGEGSLDTVELFNWRTFKQCQLPNLPVGVYGHVATSLKDVPVFCEGGKNRRSCFKMDKKTKKWVSVRINFYLQFTLTLWLELRYTFFTHF